MDSLSCLLQFAYVDCLLSPPDEGDKAQLQELSNLPETEPDFGKEVKFWVRTKQNLGFPTHLSIYLSEMQQTYISNEKHMNKYYVKITIYRKDFTYLIQA